MTDTASAASPNLLVVCIDCLREDRLRADATQTPFVDSLRTRGLECRELYASATTTTPAMASLLTGAYAERNGVQSLRRGTLSEAVDPLATLLSENGYHTEALVTGPLLPETGLDRGFDRYSCREEHESLFGDWRAEALDALESLPEPFGAVIHLWELHEDIHVPEEFEDSSYGVTPYDRALSALDPQIEALCEAVPDDTVIAVVGDHGESITHRNNPLRLIIKSVRDAIKYYGGIDTRGVVERINRACASFGPEFRDQFLENGHGENVLDVTTNVPFVLSGPAVEAATVDAQCRQIDVLPTLLRALGIDAATDGEPIDPEGGVEDRIAYMRACGASLHRERNWARAVRHDEAKYVEYPERDWDPGVYDLEADPAELSRVEDPALAARLEALLPSRGVDPANAARLDIDDRLEDLGYL